MNSKLVHLLVPPALLIAAPAAAADDCAKNDDAWFCEPVAEPATEDDPIVEQSNVVRQPAASASESEEASGPPQPIVIEPAPSIDEPSGRATPTAASYESSPSAPSVEDQRRLSRLRKEHNRTRHFGFNLRLGSQLLERSPTTHPDAGMTGVGVGFRFMPTKFFALEPGIDGYGGIDWDGRERSETTLSLNAMFFLNPDDPIQIYGLIGAFSTAAEIKNEGRLGLQTSDRYSYVGGQVGAGLELRLGPALAFNGDIIGYARQRNELPGPDESNEALRRESGGGLIRGGMSLYF